MNDFREIRRLFNLSENENFGYKIQDIEELEQNLNCRLPKALRVYYLTLGMNENINASHNRLLKPGNEIGFSDDRYLVFYEENQVVAYWGIKEADLTLDNPPVYGNFCPDNEDSLWYIETQTMTSFLLLMAIYNGTFGGLKYNANSVEQITPAIVDHIKANWKEVSAITLSKQKIYTDSFYEVISLSFDENENCSAIFIGTSSQDRFDGIIDLLDVNWSYISYEDEDEDEEFEGV